MSFQDLSQPQMLTLPHESFDHDLPLCEHLEKEQGWGESKLLTDHL
jgi:hypothetical protein